MISELGVLGVLAREKSEAFVTKARKICAIGR
jgi:hypothetical protein